MNGLAITVLSSFRTGNLSFHHPRAMIMSFKLYVGKSSEQKFFVLPKVVSREGFAGQIRVQTGEGKELA